LILGGPFRSPTVFAISTVPEVEYCGSAGISPTGGQPSAAAGGGGAGSASVALSGSGAGGGAGNGVGAGEGDAAGAGASGGGSAGSAGCRGALHAQQSATAATVARILMCSDYYGPPGSATGGCAAASGLQRSWKWVAGKLREIGEIGVKIGVKIGVRPFHFPLSFLMFSLISAFFFVEDCVASARGSLLRPRPGHINLARADEAPEHGHGPSAARLQVVAGEPRQSAIGCLTIRNN